MKAIQTFFAWVCVILFVVTGILSLFLFNVERKAFSAETFKQAFKNQTLYERMPAILANALYTSVSQGANSDLYLKALTEDNWNAIVSNLLPPEELKSLTDSAVNSVFDYLNNKTDSVILSLVPFKSHLAGPQGMEVIKQIIKAQPDCTAEQLMQMGSGLLGGKVILCNPPEEMLGLITPLIESQIGSTLNNFPDELTLISASQSGTSADPRISLNRVRMVMKWSPVLPWLFLLGMTAFAVRDLTDWLKWWGWSFLIAGAISTVIAAIGSPVLGLVVQKVIQGQGAGFIPPILFSTLSETVSAVSRQILKPVIVEGIILALIGTGMISGDFIINRRASLAPWGG